MQESPAITNDLVTRVHEVTAAIYRMAHQANIGG